MGYADGNHLARALAAEIAEAQEWVTQTAADVPALREALGAIALV